jgi:hypothetical protein
LISELVHSGLICEYPSKDEKYKYIHNKFLIISNIIIKIH